MVRFDAQRLGGVAGRRLVHLQCHIGTDTLSWANPMLWALDDERDDDLLVVRYPYFEQPKPMRWVAAQTYTGDEDELAHPVTYEWNHGLADIITAILDAGLILTSFQEHRHADWKALASMVEGPTATGACRTAPSACR